MERARKDDNAVPSYLRTVLPLERTRPGEPTCAATYGTSRSISDPVGTCEQQQAT